MGRALALVAGLLALAGCGGAAAEKAAPPAPAGFDNRAAAERFLAESLAPPKPQAAAAAAVPAGFRLRTVADADLALALPARWAALRAHDARRPGALSLLGGLSDELAPAVAALAAPDSPLKLLAFDPRFERGFPTTISVLQVHVPPGRPFAAWRGEAVRYVRGLAGRRGPVASRAVALPFGRALRLAYARLSAGRLVATVQYVVVAGERETIVTLTTLPALVRRYEPILADALRTLRPA